jgi:hypothetical protein
MFTQLQIFPPEGKQIKQKSLNQQQQQDNVVNVKKCP